MNINWFCPLLPEKTDIAHYTSRILNDLTKNANIKLWTYQKSWLPEIAKQADVVHFNPRHLSSQGFGHSHCNIYHIGNNNQFHGAIWQASRQFPGIVVIHDVNLHYLFTSMYEKYMQPGNDRNAFIELMQHYHGLPCKQDIDRFFVGQLDWSTLAERYPLTEAAVENALGVVVHTQAAFEFFNQNKEYPVLHLPLPYSFKNERVSPKSACHPPYKLIIFGHLGGMHRRVQSVLQALGQLPERNLFHLDIYGEVWDTEYLDKLIHQFNLENHVALHGFVKESVLDMALSNADLAINLRYPTGGEASGSQLRIWHHALPSLVTRLGWYAQLPEDSVAFVRQAHEIEDIQATLRQFLNDPDRFATMGRQGYQVLKQEHNPATYAQRIIEFSRSACHKSKGVSPALRKQLLQKPRVSVVIPVFNQAAHIQYAVESVLQQTFKQYEIIVVDDASTDGTVDRVSSYRDQFRYASFQECQGLSVARNRGLEMAKGEFVVFLEASDYLMPSALEVQTQWLDAHPELGMVNSGFRIVDFDDNLLSQVEPWQHIKHLSLETWLFSKSILALSSMMFRREWLLWAGGFDTRFQYAEDLNLVLRMALLNCQTNWLHKVVSCHRWRACDASNIPFIEQSLKTVLLDFFSHSNLPESVRALKDKAFFQYSVWLAWNAFRCNQSVYQTECLRKSLHYIKTSPVEIISKWVNLFQHFSVTEGYSFDAYTLSKCPEWQELTQSLLASPHVIYR